MIDPNDVEEMILPDDLRALDAELASIRYEERPSFAPELRQELERAWREPAPYRTSPWRHLAAAAVAGVLVAGVSVPQARASLVRFLGTFAADAAPALDSAPTRAEAPAEAAPVVEVAAVEPVPLPATPSEDVEPAVPTVPLDIGPTQAPRMVDRELAVFLLELAYPEHLQRAGIGGEVWLRARIDASGRPAEVSVLRGSGEPALDRAALEVAPQLRFDPAVQGGTPVATWIDFPVLFEPDPTDVRELAPPPVDDPLRLPSVHPDEAWELERPLDFDDLPDGASAGEGLTGVEAALVDAIGSSLVRRRLGAIEAIASGVAPVGRAPDEWRATAVDILEGAMARSPGNPAPALALGRIRLRQGLRTEARMLFEQGLQAAILSGSVHPEVVADLHYERGRLIREAWRSSHRVGRVYAYAFDEAYCSEARASRTASTGFASLDRLIAWNYLCPTELAHVLDVGFEETDDGSTDLSLMMGSFRAAVAAVPGHAGANVGMLVTLAENGRWGDVLAGARRFARRSGHPHALLLAGLALHELERHEEAREHFEEALARMTDDEAAAFTDVTPLLDPAELAEYRRLWGEERRAWEARYWASKDRAPSTEVSEREVQHLARQTVALLRFGGTTSDAGEVWVRFGGPYRIHVVDDGAGKLTEFWDYGSGPDITFVRWVASQSMDLTAEGRAYVDDLGKIFPPE